MQETPLVRPVLAHADARDAQLLAHHQHLESERAMHRQIDGAPRRVRPSNRPRSAVVIVPVHPDDVRPVQPVLDAVQPVVRRPERDLQRLVRH